jgi:hypothetical protein
MNPIGIKGFEKRAKLVIENLSIRWDYEVIRNTRKARKEFDNAETCLLPIFIGPVNQNCNSLRPHRRMDGDER